MCPNSISDLKSHLQTTSCLSVDSVTNTDSTDMNSGDLHTSLLFVFYVVSNTYIEAIKKMTMLTRSIITDGFRGFTQYFHVNTGIVS